MVIPTIFDHVKHFREKTVQIGKKHRAGRFIAKPSVAEM